MAGFPQPALLPLLQQMESLIAQRVPLSTTGKTRIQEALRVIDARPLTGQPGEQLQRQAARRVLFEALKGPGQRQPLRFQVLVPGFST